MQPSPDHSQSTAHSTAHSTAAAPVAETGALLGGLETLDGRPLAEHVEVFEQIHARLQGALREIDSA